MARRPQRTLLLQRGIGMRPELDHQVGVLLRPDLPWATRNRLGRQRVGLGELLQVAVDGAHADAEDLGGMRLTRPRLDRLDQMTSEIEGIGAHQVHLQRPQPQCVTQSTIPQAALEDE